MSKLKSAAKSYKKLELLDQLMIENRKKAQEDIDNISKNQNDEE